MIAQVCHREISQHAYCETSLSQGWDDDDEAKMAAQLRVLPPRDQEIFKKEMKIKHDRTPI